MPNLKTLPARVKVADDPGGTGVVEALVATYDTDSSGDRIIPGAFTKTLDDWASSGNSIPFIWSHMHNDLDAYLGDVLAAKETDDGLWVQAQLDMDDPKAAKAFRLIKGGRVSNYSFAYEVLDSSPDEKTGDNLLKELKLYEVGPCLIGMNQQTRTLAAKQDPDEDQESLEENPPQGATELAGETASTQGSRPIQGEKAGRVLSAKNEADLRTATDLILGVLAQLDRDQEKTSDESGPATDKEPPAKGATAKEPSRTTPVNRLAAVFAIHEMEGTQR